MINILIILIIIVLIILVLKNREFFSVDKVVFIHPTDVCRVLGKLKNDYKYNIQDITLRDINKKYENNIYKFYCDNLLEFTEIEKKLLIWCFDTIKKKIKTQNLKIDLLFIFENIRIAKFENFVDNGYPHTNDNIIFLTSNFINRLLTYFNSGDEENMIINIGSVIIHECIHIWQRRNPSAFLNLYTKYWHFSNPQKIYNIEFIEKIRRFNPDGKKMNWVFNYNKKHILLASIYKNNADDIGDVDYVGLFLDKQNGKYSINEDRQTIRNLKNIVDIDEFSDFFTHIYGNHYHPNELSAELLSIYYLKTLKLSHKKFTNIAYKNMLIWLKTVLKSKK